ncbi:MAG: endonuclease/exonuclease/phosphatase family protein [Chitinophagaceae bacterium]
MLVFHPRLKGFCYLSFSIVSVFTAIIYLLACFTQYISPARFWIMGFLGLGFPVLFLLVCLMALLWLVINRKIGLAWLVLVSAGYKNISVSFAWNRTKVFSPARAAGTVRILSWNIRDFDTHDLARDSARSLRHEMLDYIAAQDADILCLQDFSEYNNPLLPSNIQYLADSLGYPYHYFADDYKQYPPWGPAYSGIAIFSRYPIGNIVHIMYPGKKTPESIIVADIAIRNNTRRFIITHLQSMHLKDTAPEEINTWDIMEDSAIIYSTSKFKKLQFFLPYHALQSELVKKQIVASPFPVIFSGDLNEVPASYTYHNIRGKLNDVFLMKGFGLGRTYYSISPTLRIDHIFVSPSIEVVQYKKDDIFMSDHYPQVMDVKW